MSQANMAHGLCKIKRSYINNECLASVIPLANIHRSVHLFPSFGQIAPREWTSENVLEQCETFFLDTFSDHHAFHTMIP